MDEVRNLLGEYFFVREKADIPGREAENMKYPKRYCSLAEFEREELHNCKINWTIDDFFDEVFLSGEMELEFIDGVEGKGLCIDDLEGDIEE